MGVVESLNRTTQMIQWDGTVSEGVELTIKGKISLDEAYIGCSIAVNGVCLTATSLNNDKVHIDHKNLLYVVFLLGLITS